MGISSYLLSSFGRRGSSVGETPTTPPLTWEPPEGWQGFVPKTLVPGGNHFDNDKDYIAVIPDGHLEIGELGMGFNGGRHIVIAQPDGSGGYKLGGRITMTGPATNDHGVFSVNPHWDGNQPPMVDRILHIEGVLIDGDGVNDIVSNGQPNTILQFQNCHIAMQHGAQDEAHCDLIQMYRAWKEIRVDSITTTTEYQGLFLDRQFDATPPGPVYLRRVNIRSGGRGAAYPFWVTTTGTRRVQIDGDTVRIQPGRNAFGKSVWPDIDAAGDSKPNLFGTAPKQRAEWPNLTNPFDSSHTVMNWAGDGLGNIVEFDPASDSDYCLASVPGTAYVSPGYGAAKPTPWQPVVPPGEDIEVVGSDSFGGFTSSGKVTVPLTAQANDLVVVVGETSRWQTITPPGALTPVLDHHLSDTTGTGANTSVWTGVVGSGILAGEELEFTFPSDQNLGLALVLIRADDGSALDLLPATPVDAVSSAASPGTSTIIAPDVEFDASGLLLFIAGKSDTAEGLSAPSGYDRDSFASRTNASVIIASKWMPTPGFSGAANSSVSAGAAAWNAAHFLVYKDE